MTAADSNPIMPSAPEPVRMSGEAGIAVIEIDNPPVNATSHAVRAGLLAAIVAAEADPQVQAVVIGCAGRTFVAGADIAEFALPPREPHLPDVLRRIGACAKPVIAALHGTVLGGGLELAMWCHARIALAGTRLGLPEVKLGLVPGAGGTQLLPRLAGVATAIRLAASGDNVDAARAEALGLVDAVVPADLRRAAIALATERAAAPPRRTADLRPPPSEPAAVEAALAEITRKMRGQDAPLEVARLTRLAETAPLATALADERASFLRLKDGAQSRALRHLFFAEREAGRLPELKDVKPLAITTVGVIGLGTMGAGIAAACLDAGLSVVGVETTPAAADAGRGRIEALLARALRSGRIDQATHATRLARLQIVTDRAGLAGAELVIEAAFEDMAVKKDIFLSLERVLPRDAIIATNTSYLDIDAMASVLEAPERVVGLHFFAPANVMRLLEVVRARETSREVLASALGFAARLGKVAVVAGVCDGFIGNRIYARYRAQCEFMLEEGASPGEIDEALQDYGFAMGPFAVQDLSGLDIAWARRKRLAPGRAADERHVGILEQLCEVGRFGQKAGKGWYAYAGGERQPDPEVDALIAAWRAGRGVTPRRIEPAEIVARAHATLINEAAKVLAEGIAARPADIDVAFVHGYGFPRWRGGPLHAADAEGLPRLLSLLEDRAPRDGRGFEVAPLLRELAESGRTFADLDRPGR